MVPRKHVKNPTKLLALDPLGTTVLGSGSALQFTQVMTSGQITARWSSQLLAGCLVSTASCPRREAGRAYPVSASVRK